VGNYGYPDPGLARPHGVLSIDGDLITATFTYDANGNQTNATGIGRSIAYNAANKPSTITQGSLTLNFADDVDHQRYKQTMMQGSVVTTTQYFDAFGVHTERVVSATTQWNDYIMVGGSMIGVRFVQGTNVTLRYFHQDHLGSIAVLTDQNGAIVERDAYDPWGKRRYWNNGADDTAGILPSQSQTIRGFTGQEMLASVGLVHLNGRVYDPYIGRMTSVDPLIGNRRNSQTFNGYSYALNNPLVNSDPTGFDTCDECHNDDPDHGNSNETVQASPPSSDPPVISPAENPSPSGTAPSDVTSSGDTGANPNETTPTNQVTPANSPGVAPFTATLLPEIRVGRPTGKSEGGDEGISGEGFSSRAAGCACTPEPNIIYPSAGDVWKSYAQGLVQTAVNAAWSLTGFGYDYGMAPPRLFGSPASTVGYSQGAASATGILTVAPGFGMRAAGGGATIESQLMRHVDDAVSRFNAVGFTRAQAARVQANPKLAPVFTGERIDTFFKQAVSQDLFLKEQGFQVTPRFQFGPDVFNRTTNVWYDVTTAGQWSTHVDRYTPAFGQGTPLFYGQ
jgi:RHS repeat-associated protein